MMDSVQCIPWPNEQLSSIPNQDKARMLAVSGKQINMAITGNYSMFLKMGGIYFFINVTSSIPFDSPSRELLIICPTQSKWPIQKWFNKLVPVQETPNSYSYCFFCPPPHEFSWLLSYYVKEVIKSKTFIRSHKQD